MYFPEAFAVVRNASLIVSHEEEQIDCSFWVIQNHLDVSMLPTSSAKGKDGESINERSPIVYLQGVSSHSVYKYTSSGCEATGSGGLI
jgi:hypothetical protein